MRNDNLERSLLLFKKSYFKLQSAIEGDIDIFRIDDEIMLVFDL